MFLQLLGELSSVCHTRQIKVLCLPKHFIFKGKKNIKLQEINIGMTYRIGSKEVIPN